MRHCNATKLLLDEKTHFDDSTFVALKNNERESGNCNMISLSNRVLC